MVTLSIHGANWIILKTNSSINDRLKPLIFKLNIVLLIFTIISLLVWQNIQPEALSNFFDKPWLVVFPFVYFTGLFGLFFIKKFKKDLYGFIFSTMLILGGITSSLASMFPVILPSTNDMNESLTIYNTAAHEYGLTVAMGWGIIGFILLFMYMIIQKRLMGGKIDEMDYGHS